MSDTQELIDLISSKTKLVAMLAPSFPIVYDYPQIISALKLLVLTYKELKEVFDHFHIDPETTQIFDLGEKNTRTYPLDGGLSQTSAVNRILRPEEIRVVSGWDKCPAALVEFENNPTIRLLDILFCEGGCINGPGIESLLTTQQRKEKILAFSKTQ